jgi:hypothetical protein
MTEDRTYTAEEWATIAAMRQMPLGPVYHAAACSLEYVLADRTGDTIREVALDDDMWTWIDEMVRGGRFNTRGEVVEAAVRRFLAEHDIGPVSADAPAESPAPSPASRVYHSTPELADLAARILDLMPANSTPTLVVNGDKVKVPAEVTNALRAVLKPLRQGLSVSVTPVPTDP